MLAGAPAGFLLGAATSAHQIEGGTRNDWTEWEKGRYPDGTPARRRRRQHGARRRLVEPVAVGPGGAAAAGRQRLPGGRRVEPPRARAEGAWDEAAAAHYREMFAGLRAAGIAPIVTLYHFTLPPWVAARGGWDWDGAPAALAAFAARAGAAFGAQVDWWCTINEPNVLVAKGYLVGGVAARRARSRAVPRWRWRR